MEQKQPDKDRLRHQTTGPGDEFPGTGAEPPPGSGEQAVSRPEGNKVRETPKAALSKQTLRGGDPRFFSGPLHCGHEPIPGYRLEAFLGRGQYGEVWSASGPGHVRVALKFIDLRGSQGLKEFRGIQRVKAIRHAHLMPITGLWMIGDNGEIVGDEVLADYDPAGDSVRAVEMLVETSRPTLLVVAMLLASGSLEDRLAECKAEGHVGIPRDELLGYMEEAAKGIDFLNTPRHDFGDGPLAIQHCDIKPANLVLVGNSVLVCDFGLARLLGDATATATGVLGSLAYMAPESIARRPGRASDQYALAISYYELRTGRLPFASEDFTAVMDAHRSGRLDFSCVPPAEQDVLQRATAVNAGSRFATCSDFVRQLRTPAAAPAPRSSPAPRSRRRWAAIVAAAALLLACAFGGWAALSLLIPPPSPQPTGEQRLLALEPAAPQVLIDGAPISADSSGRFQLPKDNEGPFELRIPAPDNEHADYVRTLTIEELSQLDFRIAYAFPAKQADEGPADEKMRAREAAELALQLADQDRFDEALTQYKAAIRLDEQYAAVPLPQFVLPATGVRGLAMVPGGRWLVTGGVGGKLLRWDLANLSSPPESLGSLEGTVEVLGVSPAGRWVACGTSPGTVFLRELDDRTPQNFELLHGTPEKGATEIRVLAFSSDERLLAVATGQSADAPPLVHLWTLADADPPATHRELKGHTENINALAFSHDSRWLYSGGIDNRVLRWDAATAQPQPEVIRDGPGDVHALACHPSQPIVALGGIGTGVELISQQAGGPNTRTLRGHTADIEVVAFNDDGSRLVTADQNGFTLLWDASDFSLLARLEGQLGIIADAAFIPPGNWLATASWDQTVGLWDLSAKTKTPLLLEHPDKLQAVCASPNGRLLATLAEDGVVRIWNVSRCKLVKRACDDLGRIPLRRHHEKEASLEVHRGQPLTWRLALHCGPGAGP